MMTTCTSYERMQRRLQERQRVKGKSGTGTSSTPLILAVRRMLEKNTYFSNVLSKTEFVEMPYVTLADGQRKQRLGKGIKWKFREPQIGLVQELPPVVSQSSSSSRTGETLIEVPGVVQPPRSSGAVGI